VEGKRIIVSHAGYGCDTGCCGHVIEVDGEQVGSFHFDHPYAGIHASREEKERVYREFAEELVRDELGEAHVADLDWEDCLVIDD
jgi:hypothetical protein